MNLSGAIVKLRYAATAEQARRIDHGKLTAALYAAGAHKVWKIEAEIERETRARVEGVDDSLTELESLNAYIEAQGIDASTAEAMRARTQTYIEEVAS